MSRASVVEEITVEALTDDPYPIYAELRRTAPVAYVPAVNLWFVVEVLHRRSRQLMHPQG